MTTNNNIIHITVETRELNVALAKVATMIARVTTLPILRDVLLSYEDGQFTLTAAHPDGHRLTISVQMNLIKSSEKQWRVCLPASDLLQAVKALPQHSGAMLQLYIDREKSNLRIQYMILENQQGEYSMPVEPADEFPAAPELEEKSTLCRIEVPTSWLLPRFKAARVCTSTEEIRPQMGCVAVDVTEQGGAVVVVSTNGQMLTKASLNVGVGSEETPMKAGSPFTFLVHSSLISTICNVFQATDMVSIATDGNHHFVFADGVSMVCAFPDGRYPKYNSVIPQNNDKEVTVCVRDFMSALRRVSLFSNDSSNMGVLTFDGENLCVEASDNDFSKAAKEDVRLQHTNIEGMLKIGFKISNLLSLLGIITTDNVRLSLSDQSRPMLLFEEDANSSLCCLIMPMLLNV